MLLPRTRSLFKLPREVVTVGREASPDTRHRRLSLLWLLAVLLLIIVISTLLVDAADWLVRLLNEPLESVELRP
jgi:Ca2+/H+ antiporter